MPATDFGGDSTPQIAHFENFAQGKGARETEDDDAEAGDGSGTASTSSCRASGCGDDHLGIGCAEVDLPSEGEANGHNDPNLDGNGKEGEGNGHNDPRSASGACSNGGPVDALAPPPNPLEVGHASRVASLRAELEGASERILMSTSPMLSPT